MSNGRLLEEILLSGINGKHTLIVIGKGGVGKTTFSILAGITYSKKGKTLIASLDPAKHLLGYLNLEKPLKISEIMDNLYAVQYDIGPLAKKLSDEYSIILKQVMPGLTIVNLDDVVKAIRHAPGFEEEIFLRILEELYRSDYDYVVIDTPPTGITHRILNLPNLHMFWIEKLYELRARIISLRYAMARALGKDYKPHDPVLRKLEELHEKYKGMWNDLRDPKKTSVAIVATPEPLPIYEAKSTLDLLNKLGIACRLLVINRILPKEASKLGLLDIQEKSIKEAKEIVDKQCEIIGIMHHKKPPKSLVEVLELVDLIVPLLH
ncbi:MAG: ArsA family ATPase [Desulfurococcales archaeon]|nr:ArsA family ATPase [Desulfurococcales archaeon]